MFLTVLVVLGMTGEIPLPLLLGLHLPVWGFLRRLSLMLPLRLKISFMFLFSFESWVIPSVRDFTDTIKSWILCSESDYLLLAKLVA